MKDHTYYMRNPRIVAVTSADHVLMVSHDRMAVRHASGHPAGWSQLWQKLANPVKGGDAHAYFDALPELEDALWDQLVAEGFVLESAQSEVLSQQRNAQFTDNQGFHLFLGEPTCNHLLFACTGSVVAGLMAPTILSLSHSRFQERLDVVLTETAQRFITRDLIESYGIRTWSGHFERRDGIFVPHVHLGSSTDCIVIMPATANCLHRLVNSACSDLLSTIVAASTAPVVIAPAMNHAMWNDVGVQRNVQRLRDDGMYVIEPTLIFGAATFATQSDPMYGGHGTLWAGPSALMCTLAEILRHHAAE